MSSVQGILWQDVSKRPLCLDYVVDAFPISIDFNLPSELHVFTGSLLQ